MAPVVKWYHASFPSLKCGFDSHRALYAIKHKALGTFVSRAFVVVDALRIAELNVADQQFACVSFPAIVIHEIHMCSVR